MLKNILFMAFVFSGQFGKCQGLKTCYIPLYENKSNVMEIDISVNKYTCRFIFDPGASMISFGKSLYDSLVKTNYINVSDIKYKTKTKLANGSLADALVITLKHVNIGDFELKDVEALVMDANEVPQLMGQNIIQRFSTYKIDNKNKQLILEMATDSSVLLIDKLKFIPCSAEVLEEVNKIKHGIQSDSTVKVGEVTQETNVPPPPNAIARLTRKLTIRFFDRNDYTKAENIKNRLFTLGYKKDEVLVEDMSQYYKNPITNYFELWVK